MKVLITEDSLDSLLSIKISSDGGKTYTDHSVSSLKNGGITFDCSPSDLKVICDANVLKYIQVLADGEKSTSNVDLSDYIKFKDIYVDVYKNPYYGVTLTDDEISKLSDLDSSLYNDRNYEYYCSGNDFCPDDWCHSLRLISSDTYIGGESTYQLYAFLRNDSVYMIDDFYLSYHNLEDLDLCYLITEDHGGYMSSGKINFFTNVRIHFIKHF